jgi:hypothetical protein
VQENSQANDLVSKLQLLLAKCAFRRRLRLAGMKQQSRATDSSQHMLLE